MMGRDLNSPRTVLYLFLIACIVGYALPALTAVFTANHNGVQIDIDANIESGRVVEVYVNGSLNPPHTAAIVPGSRRTYTLSKILEDVTSLRIDLGKVSNTSVEIYGITVSIDGRPAKHYGPDDIYRWLQAQSYSVTSLEKFADRVRYVQKGWGPSLIVTDAFNGAAVPRYLRWLLPLDRNKIVLVFAATALGLVAIARAPLLVRTLCMFIFLGVAAASVAAVHVANAMFNWPDPVNQAVGRAGFNGLSLLPNRMAAAATLAAAVLLGVTAVFIMRRYRHRSIGGAATDTTVEPIERRLHRGRWRRGLVITFVVVLIASLYLADVYPYINNLRFPLRNEWDFNNYNFWQYLVYEGFRPLRDFWFPYSGTWIFGLPAPWGQLSQTSMNAAVHIVLFLALVRLFRIAPSIVILCAVLVGENAQLMEGAWRYLLSVDVVLSYVAIGDIRNRFHSGHVLFGVALSLALFFGTEQALYAAPAGLAMLSLDLVQRKLAFGRDIFLRIALEFALPIAFLVIYYSFISDFDELRELVSFLFSLPALAYSSAAPTNLIWPFQVGYLLLAGSAGLVGVGLYRRLSNASAVPVVDDVLITLGLVGFMFFQKELVRSIEWQLIAPLMVAMFISLAVDPAFRCKRSAVVGGFVAGLLFWSLDIDGAAGNLIRQTAAAPLRVLEGIETAIRSPQIVAEARKNTYSAERFSAFTGLIEVVGGLRTLGGGELPRSVYVIGDSPMLYALLHQAPPYSTNDYNTSAVVDQRRVLEWVERQQPQFAVWNTNDVESDGLQRVVRVPLLYSMDAATFVPVTNVGTYAILRRRAEGELPALAWWRDRLGGNIDFGGLLRRSSFSDLADCSDAPSLDKCTPFLEVAVPVEFRSQPRLAISVMAGDLSFRVEFAPSAKVGTYRVRLDRLWFWNAARKAGWPVRVVGADKPGVAATMVFKAPDDRDLY